MNAHAPHNKPATSLQQTLFALQGYGVQVYLASKIVALPIGFRAYAQVCGYLSALRQAGWHVQIGILK